MIEHPSVLIIAEIGVNHNGSLELAKKMVDAAAVSDLDYIKFQTVDADLLLVDDAPKAEYQKSTTGEAQSAKAMIEALQLDRDEFRELKTHVESRGKKFLSTAFDLPSVDFLHELGLRLFKIPSGEITNLPYLRRIAARADDIILSTGMSTLDEVRAAVDAIVAAGFPRDHITVLQCNTAYPSPIDDANLLAMVSLGGELGVRYGYSDHTPGPYACLAAVALGATVIEKHFTTDSTLPGPDQRASMEPDDFARLVDGIRQIERSLGSAEKIVTESERENRPVARRGVYAARDLVAGEVLTLEDLVCLRPETSLSPMSIDSVIGRVLTQPIGRRQPIIVESLSA